MKKSKLKIIYNEKENIENKLKDFILLKGLYCSSDDIFIEIYKKSTFGFLLNDNQICIAHVTKKGIVRVEVSGEENINICEKLFEEFSKQLNIDIFMLV